MFYYQELPVRSEPAYAEGFSCDFCMNDFFQGPFYHATYSGKDQCVTCAQSSYPPLSPSDGLLRCLRVANPTIAPKLLLATLPDIPVCAYNIYDNVTVICLVDGSNIAVFHDPSEKNKSPPSISASSSLPTAVEAANKSDLGNEQVRGKSVLQLYGGWWLPPVPWNVIKSYITTVMTRFLSFLSSNAGKLGRDLPLSGVKRSGGAGLSNSLNRPLTAIQGEKKMDDEAIIGGTAPPIKLGTTLEGAQYYSLEELKARFPWIPSWLQEVTPIPLDRLAAHYLSFQKDYRWEWAGESTSEGAGFSFSYPKALTWLPLWPLSLTSSTIEHGGAKSEKTWRKIGGDGRSSRGQDKVSSFLDDPKNRMISIRWMLENHPYLVFVLSNGDIQICHGVEGSWCVFNTETICFLARYGPRPHQYGEWDGLWPTVKAMAEWLNRTIQEIDNKVQEDSSLQQFMISV